MTSPKSLSNCVNNRDLNIDPKNKRGPSSCHNSKKCFWLMLHYFLLLSQSICTFRLGRNKSSQPPSGHCKTPLKIKFQCIGYAFTTYASHWCKNRLLLFRKLLQHLNIFKTHTVTFFWVSAFYPLCPGLQNGKTCHKRIVKSTELDVYKKVQTFVLVNMCFLFSPLTPQRIPVILMKPIFI